MANDMPSWRPISSKLANFKSYLNPRDSSSSSRAARPRQLQEAPRTQSWGQWAGEKLKGISGSEGSNSGNHRLSLFPGWAARRYQRVTDNLREDPFDVDLFVSGFAVSYTSPENASRSQKAFIRLAKGFANLPKIAGTISPTNPSPPFQRLSPSTEELLKQIHLPPRPTEITEESEVQALEDHFRNLDFDTISTGSDTSSMMSRSSSSSSAISSSPSTLSEPSGYAVSPGGFKSSLHQLHFNLEQRLQPFWSSTLPNRPVRLTLFTGPCSQDHPEADQRGHKPLAVQKVKTAADGSFQWRFSVPYERMCTHPGALEVVFGDPTVEHNFYVLAELLPPPPPEQVPTTYAARQPPQHVHASSEPTAKAQIQIPLSHCPVRVISDIDDTVKMSSIISGARAIFHNVFVKDLKDLIIPGMGEWYTWMWKRGVRFHYVSNGPFELLPVLSEFFQISSLPPGSVKLKSYAGRSLFNGLLSAPAQRKRAGVAEILDNFCDSRFFLVGDSGEQDLELYATMAADRPDQILAIFIRDVNQYDEGVTGLDDPRGTRPTSVSVGVPATPRGGKLAAPVRTLRNPKRAMSELLTPTTPRERTSSYLIPGRSHSRPPSIASAPSTPTDYFSSNLHSDSISASPSPIGMPESPASSHNELPDAHDPYADPEATPMPDHVTTFAPNDVTIPGAGRAPQGLSVNERRRFELQQRVYKARAIVPPHIPIRVFREPQECVEAADMLDKLFVGTQPEITGGSQVYGP
ncbi:hypothetical protein PUNSTDRAFT_143017 [Punctularia strigosozonata HHB-11173 SS5]|uniref:uncharacterized protein n=1 Tax=Punctularia strigosozonata (strain HHB-11173) TaxID=741275 RepID=UPI000441686E|nr:uncharacterized protein PUNSTDRAFT_143017 [Punctularia strigosozonata HHB-11173 SS5]EIN09461.1 hypothetical protein PUNSTDRAFT_143017 [Punctularia strigosozonata HHB-11173 SS5]